MSILTFAAIAVTLAPWTAAATTKKDCAGGSCDVDDSTNLMQVKKTVMEGSERSMNIQQDYANSNADPILFSGTLQAIHEEKVADEEAARKRQDFISELKKRRADTSDVDLLEEEDQDAVGVDCPGGDCICCCKEGTPIQECLVGKDKKGTYKAAERMGDKTAATAKSKWKKTHEDTNYEYGSWEPRDYNLCCKPRKGSSCDYFKGYTKYAYNYRLEDGNMDATTCKPGWSKEDQVQQFGFTCPDKATLKCDLAYTTTDLCTNTANKVHGTQCQMATKLKCFFASLGRGFGFFDDAGDNALNSTGKVAGAVTLAKDIAVGIDKDSPAKAGLSQFSETYKEIMPPGMSFTSFFLEVLSLVAGVCTGDFTKCQVGLSVFKLVMMVVGILLTLTGVGLPFAAMLAMSQTSGFIGMLVGQVCKEVKGDCGGVCAFKKVVDYYFKDAKVAAADFVAKFKAKGMKFSIVAFGKATVTATAGLVKLPLKFLYETLRGIVKACWSILTAIPYQAKELYKKVVGITAKTNKKALETEYIRDECCAAQKIAALTIGIGTDPDDKTSPDKTAGCWTDGLTDDCCIDAATKASCWPAAAADPEGDGGYNAERCCKGR